MLHIQNKDVKSDENTTKSVKRFPAIRKTNPTRFADRIWRCNTLPEDTYRRKIQPGSKTTGQRLNRAIHAFHRLYQASSFGGLFNIGPTKTLLFSGFDQNAQINLITCRNSELMAGSQYPQTTRSLLKSGLLLLIILLLFLFSR